MINFGIKYEIQKINSGDYTAKIKTDDKEYYSSIVIERKNGLDEISQNLTKNKQRFEKEFNRAEQKIIIAIEENTYSDIIKNNYRSQLNANAFLALLHSITDKYGIHFIFIPKEVMAVFIYKTFYYNLRNILKGEK